jgi:hypothetical protein
MCYEITRMVTRGEMVTSLERLEAFDAELCGVALGEGILRLAMAEGLEALAQCGAHHELGLRRSKGTLERCERSVRWVQGSRALARRLAELPAIRRALVRGEIGFCMAQVIAGVAHAEDEKQWVEEARRRTVREMRALIRDGMGPGPVFAAADEPRATLTVTVDREDGWLFEHARLLGKHAGTGKRYSGCAARGRNDFSAGGGGSLRGRVVRRDLG